MAFCFLIYHGTLLFGKRFSWCETLWLIMQQCTLNEKWVELCINFILPIINLMHCCVGNAFSILYILVIFFSKLIECSHVFKSSDFERCADWFAFCSQYRSKFTNEETIMFCLRVMVGVIILYDHVHPVGAFAKTSPINVSLRNDFYIVTEHSVSVLPSSTGFDSWLIHWLKCGVCVPLVCWR